MYDVMICMRWDRQNLQRSQRKLARNIYKKSTSQIRLLSNATWYPSAAEDTVLEGVAPTAADQNALEMAKIHIPWAGSYHTVVVHILLAAALRTHTLIQSSPWAWAHTHSQDSLHAPPVAVVPDDVEQRAM